MSRFETVRRVTVLRALPGNGSWALGTGSRALGVGAWALGTVTWMLLGAVALVAAAPNPAPSPSAPVFLDVPLGVRVEVKLDRRISTQDDRTGERFNFETTRAFTLGDLVVPRGTHGWGQIELAEPRAGKDHGGRLSLSVHSLDLSGGRSIAVALPPLQSDPGSEPDRTTRIVPVFGAIVVLEADPSGNVVLEKGETFVVITTSTGTPPPIPHSESS